MTESNSYYLRYCKEHDIEPHPARYPAALPEYFVRMLTDPGDLVVDPFGGSCVTGEVCERLSRRWLCCEMTEDYLRGAVGRFASGRQAAGSDGSPAMEDPSNFYKLPRPDVLWNGMDGEALPADGGKTRVIATTEQGSAPIADYAPPNKKSAQLRLFERRLNPSPPKDDPLDPPR